MSIKYTIGSPSFSSFFALFLHFVPPGHPHPPSPPLICLTLFSSSSFSSSTSFSDSKNHHHRCPPPTRHQRSFVVGVCHQHASPASIHLFLFLIPFFSSFSHPSHLPPQVTSVHLRWASTSPQSHLHVTINSPLPRHLFEHLFLLLESLRRLLLLESLVYITSKPLRHYEATFVSLLPHHLLFLLLLLNRQKHH